MDLEKLTKMQLYDRFLMVHGEYLRLTNRPFRQYIYDPEFIKVEEELKELLMELQRRRGIGN